MRSERGEGERGNRWPKPTELLPPPLDAWELRSTFNRPLDRLKNIICVRVQGSAKRLSLGCMNSLPAARGSQEAGFTQPRSHTSGDPCILD